VGRAGLCRRGAAIAPRRVLDALRHRAPTTLATATILLATGGVAHAETPPPAPAPPPQAAEANEAEARASSTPRAGSDTEFDVVPIAGGDSDIGFGVGAVGALTRFAGPPARARDDRWAWRLEASAFLTFRFSPSFDVPYQDHWLLLTLPDLVGGSVRLMARAAFTKETDILYFGVGNATPAPPDYGAARYVYGRTHPIVELRARTTIASHWYVTTATSFTMNWLDVPADGKLATDMRAGPPEVRALLGDARTHGVAIFEEGVGWDDRDDEVVPRHGTWHEIALRLSPALGDAVPYGYEEVLAIARGYVPAGDRVVVALRGLADALIGQPPFYQLTEYDDTYAVGGTAGVRGVPAQRYYGKIKLIGNVEVRTDVARFRALDKPWGIALVAFFDAGRLWADWSSQPALDGTGLGLKWGTGVGVRVQQGRAFVVRGDVAWSPDARPIGGYFAAGQAF